MKVLVACEFSGIVRDAFIARGHDAWSCDLLPSEKPGNHLQGDVFNWLFADWDLVIAHPPCTDLCVSGARHFKAKQEDGRQQRSINFFMQFTWCKADKWCIENPIGIMSRIYRKPDQIIQPWQFGHGETKATCLWLKGLPRLAIDAPLFAESAVVAGREQRIHKMPPGPDRWKERSRTYPGFAEAMAEQWS